MRGLGCKEIFTVSCWRGNGTFRFLDENDYEYKIFSWSHIEHAQTNVILAGKTSHCHHFITRFCKNVVLSKQGKNTVAVWHFSIKKKAQLPAIRITEQPLLLTKRKINCLCYKCSKYFR